MNGIRPKQHARIGEFHLEEAVLDVLLDARHEGSCIGAAEISKRAGIYRDRGTMNTMNDAIVTGLLVKLHEQGRVQKCAQNPGQTRQAERLGIERERVCLETRRRELRQSCQFCSLSLQKPLIKSDHSGFFFFQTAAGQPDSSPHVNY